MNKGIVLAKTLNNNNDAILVALTCEKELTSRSGLFIDFAHSVFDCLQLDNLNLPSTLNEALSSDFIFSSRYSKSDIFSNCSTIDNAIDVISNYYKEEINLKDYKALKIVIGRDMRQVYLHINPSLTIAGAIIIGGTGLKLEEKADKKEVDRLCKLAAEKVALTNPLCTYQHELLPSIFNQIKLNSIDEAISTNMEEATNDIVTSNKRTFISSYVLAEQIVAPELTLGEAMKKYELYPTGEFVRCQLND